MVLAQRCGISSVAAVLAPIVAASEPTVRQRLREWSYAAGHKARSKRQIKRHALDVTTCFAPLLRWVLAWWPATEPQRLAAMMVPALAPYATTSPAAWSYLAVRR